MSNLGGGEIFAVLLLALIVLGPDRLPEAARKVGGWVRQVRAMSSGFQDEVRKAIDLGGSADGDKPFSPEQAHIQAIPDATSATASVPVAEDLDTDIRARNDGAIDTGLAAGPPAVDAAVSDPSTAEPSTEQPAR